MVAQLLSNRSLSGIDTVSLRARIRAFRDVISEPAPRREDIDATSRAIVEDARRIIEERNAEIGRQVPALEREAPSMMWTGFAIAWIVVVLSFAVVRTTLDNVVKPIEQISAAARRISARDLTARAPVKGDEEIAALGEAINHMADELKSHARTDELTGLPNFRAFSESIDAALLRADRYPERIGILVLDLDRFKKYNDTFGHAAGNEALRRVAATIAGTVRNVDYAARYGGEEFAVILPDADAASAFEAVNRFRQIVADTLFDMPAIGKTLRMTVSIGVALCPVDGDTEAQLIARSDAALYHAKKTGKDRVSMAAEVIKIATKPA
jgi:two-component system, sensor histidine kinase LadS